ncbi:unnamed protein product [Arctia plantaginis]|uniref:Uncharacterized protein n=1 Tax=Arctia plantaginis TaxID=874455 RepID=A0A8S1AEJ8_ARCPL|nr:unnamed protein product [Arctia plantaginis]
MSLTPRDEGACERYKTRARRAAGTTGMEEGASSTGSIKDLDVVEEWVTCLGTDMDSMKTAFTALQKRVVRLETSSVVGVKYATSVKVPFCDGSTSWTAYRQQFHTVAASNG